VIGEGGASSWTLIESEMDEDIQLIEASAAAAAAAAGSETSVVKTTEQSAVIVDSDSEEETVDVLCSSEVSSLPTKSSCEPIDLCSAVTRKQKKKKKFKMKH